MSDTTPEGRYNSFGQGSPADLGEEPAPTNPDALVELREAVHRAYGIHNQPDASGGCCRASVWYRDCPNIAAALDALIAEAQRQERVQALEQLKCVGAILSRNEHKLVYLSIAEYVESSDLDDCWVSDEEQAKAIASDELWELQWYPSTPISFHKIMASSLTAILSALLTEQGGGG